MKHRNHDYPGKQLMTESEDLARFWAFFDHACITSSDEPSNSKREDPVQSNPIERDDSTLGPNDENRRVPTRSQIQHVTTSPPPLLVLLLLLLPPSPPPHERYSVCPSYHHHYHHQMYNLHASVVMILLSLRSSISPLAFCLTLAVCRCLTACRSVCSLSWSIYAHAFCRQFCGGGTAGQTLLILSRPLLQDAISITFCGQFTATSRLCASTKFRRESSYISFCSCSVARSIVVAASDSRRVSRYGSSSLILSSKILRASSWHAVALSRSFETC